MPSTLHVVSHTHWDREWYLPFEAFRLRLVDLIDHLLEILDSDPTFHHFSLDAQTIVLEDYLAIRPEARDRLARHIEQGRIAVGPWYQLNDEFLVSGEATVRSLLLGHRIAKAFGGCMKVGYLPDQFGNISQMPQILRGFGIDNAIMGRGRQLAGDRKMEFWWESPDGSRVLSSLMAYWYNNAQYIPTDKDDAVAFFEHLRDIMRNRSAASHLLLMNGVDHLEAEPWVGSVIAEVGPVLHERSGDQLVHSSLTAYVDALRTEVQERSLELETVVGELREDRGGACLAGTLSTRVYLKQVNDEAQTEVERYAEPLSAFAWIHGSPYPAGQLRYAWKLLMQNHPHDSICGCSVDDVHDEMMTRFRCVRQVASAVVGRATDHLTGRDRTTGAVALPCELYVFNPLNWERTDPVRVVLELPLGPPSRGSAQRSADAVIRGLRITDPDGEEVPYEVTANETVITMVTNPLELPLEQWVQRIAVQFVATKVPACGYAIYRVEPADGWYTQDAAWVREEDSVAAPDLEDGGDAGDEYLYRPPLKDVTVRLSLACEPDWGLQASAVRRTRIVRSRLLLPERSDASQRSENLVECPVRLEITNWRDLERVELRLEMDNRATDHRLRSVFWVGGGSKVVAGGQFDAIVRPARPEHVAEGASPFYPMSLWVDTVERRSGKGLTVIAPGIHEFEAYTDATGAICEIALTLLRCVGQLSGRGDGPGVSTPGAQCLGKQAFSMAVWEHEHDWQEDEVWKQAHQFAVPLLAVQAPASVAKPRRASYLQVTPASLIVSAVKKAEDRDGLIVRFYNTTEALVETGQVSVPPAQRWRRVNLNEDVLEGWHEGDTAQLRVRPKEIVTLEFGL